MPSGSGKTHGDILRSAKREFLAHGFAGASLRTIAAEAGVTTGAFYRHFADKDALFRALVEPSCTGLAEMLGQTAGNYLARLESEGLNAVWRMSDGNMEMLIAYIYNRLDAFRLLLSAPEQPAYENFTRALIEWDVDLTLRYLEEAARMGYAVRRFRREELYLLTSAQYFAIFELVRQGIPREQALACAATVFRFFRSGWRELLETP